MKSVENRDLPLSPERAQLMRHISYEMEYEDNDDDSDVDEVLNERLFLPGMSRNTRFL